MLGAQKKAWQSATPDTAMPPYLTVLRISSTIFLVSPLREA